MKRKHLLVILALITVFALTLTACGSDAAETTAAATEGTVDNQPLGLIDFTMSASTWSSPNGATIHLTAVPTGHSDGQSALFVVRLEGEDVASSQCEWDGTSYTASVELTAADGYCYYVILTAADGTPTEVPVNTPTNPSYEIFINMADALTSHCNLMVTSSDSADGKLTITGGSVQVQVPKITNEGQAITCQKVELVLSYDGQQLDVQELTLQETGTAGLYELELIDITFQIPDTMEDDQQISLVLNVTLSNGQILTAPGVTWIYSDSAMLPVVG